MAILKKIKSAVKNVVTNVKKGAGVVASAVKGAIASAGNSNTAGVYNAVVGQGLNQQQTNRAINIVKSGGTASGGATGSWTPNPSSDKGSNNVNFSPIATIGNVSYGPQLPVTISANKAYTSPTTTSTLSPQLTSSIQNQSLTSSSLGGVQTGGVSTGVSPSVSTSVAPRIDNTKMAGALAGYYKYNDKGQLEPVEDKRTPQEIAAQEQADFYDKYFQEKPSIYEDKQVKEAMNQRKQIQEALQAPTAELNAIMAKQQQDLLQLRQTGAKEGVTEAVYGQQENAVNYGAAIRALPIQATIASLQGRLDLAQDYLKELTAVKTDEINRQYEYNKSRFQAIAGAVETADKRAYDAVVKENDRQYKEQTDLENFKAEIMTKALQNGASQFEINRINTASDKASAVQAAGVYSKKKDNISLSTDKKVKLLGSGLSQVDISNIEKDVKEYGLDKVLEGITNPKQKEALQNVYSSSDGTKLTRESVSSLYGIPDNESRSSILGFEYGDTNKKQLDTIMDTINKYKAVGYSDKEILKLIQE